MNAEVISDVVFSENAKGSPRVPIMPFYDEDIANNEMGNIDSLDDVFEGMNCVTSHSIADGLIQAMSREANQDQSENMNFDFTRLCRISHNDWKELQYVLESFCADLHHKFSAIQSAMEIAQLDEVNMNVRYIQTYANDIGALEIARKATLLCKSLQSMTKNELIDSDKQALCSLIDDLEDAYHSTMLLLLIVERMAGERDHESEGH